MRILARIEFDPYLVKWVGTALRRKVALCGHGRLRCAVLLDIYTVEITSNQQEGPGRTLSFADNILVYRSLRVREDVAKSAHEDRGVESNIQWQFAI